MNKIFLIMVIFLLSGCAAVTHYDQLMVLKGIGEEEKEIEQYTKKQEALFLKLKNAVKAGGLTKGMSKREILSTYGEPIFCDSTEKEGITEYCLYRHPTEFFTTDKIYLYFDQQQKLHSWKTPHN